MPFPIRHITLSILGFLLGITLPLHADTGGRIVTAARRQVGVTTIYDPAYVSLAYPLGDVPQDRGVCTGVIIRALRTALSQDLQQLVHEDMKSHFSAYPKQWGPARSSSITSGPVPRKKTPSPTTRSPATTGGNDRQGRHAGRSASRSTLEHGGW